MNRKFFAFLVFVLFAAMSSTDAGWYTQTSGTTSLLVDGFFSDPQTGWVVGITNTILHTTDGGTSWIDQSPPPSVNYYSVYFIDNQTGCAVGATVGGSGRIRHTTNAGSTWNIISPPADAYSLWGIYFADANNGWIAGGREENFNIRPIRTIHYSSTEGITWSSQLYQYDSLPLHDVHFVDANIGCAVGEHGGVFWTTDGGTNWLQRPSPTFRHLWGVYLLDDSTAWAVGVRGTILKTVDAGYSWSAVSADSTCGFGKIIFTDALNGWIAGSSPDSGIILNTSDGGNSWQHQYTGTEHGLMSIYFTDSDTGWAVGNIGTILHTTDGGAVGIDEEEDKDSWGVGIKKRELTCYPNPFTTSTRIQVLGASRKHPIELSIWDVSGRFVKTVTLETSTYQLGTDLKAGIYFISAAGLAKQKIIKIR